MKKIIAILAGAVMLFSAQVSSDAKVKTREVTFVTSMDCAHCAKKVTENISFVKGVKDLEVKIEDKTVRIVYNPDKTSEAVLKKEIEKLGYTAEKI